MTQISMKIARAAAATGSFVGGKLPGCNLVVVTFSMAAVLSGCMGKFAPPPAPPPPAATVAHPLEKEVVEWDTFSGHLQSPEMANVAARVSGLVMQMPFTEGAIVKRGELLAVIDDRPFKADLDAKLADKQRAESTLALAKITHDRMIVLKKKNAVAEQDFDNSKAACDQAAAVLAGAKAAVATAQLNLEWCRVLAPIEGRVSDKLVTVGNLVTGGAGPAPATLLTTVTSVDPMYCYVDVDEHSILKYQKLAAERKLLSVREGKLPCYVGLENESGFPHEGFVDFMDNHIDPTTGTMRVRAVLPNKSGKLIPGYYARLRVPGSGRYRTLLLPDQAIGSDQNQHNVLVLDKDNNVQVRVVKLGALFGGLRAILSGITAEDRVVINGQMHARPGAKVQPKEEIIKADEGAFSDPGTAIAERDSMLDTPPAGGKGNRPILAATRLDTQAGAPVPETRREHVAIPGGRKGDGPVLAGTKTGTVPEPSSGARK
jgi:RND family efflux transporter MFP subunit